jgi:DNA-binding MarR family transcriptional regulator
VSTRTLGYLLKHVQQRFSSIADAALAPLGITGRYAAVLRTIGTGRPVSQGECARRLGVDRTTMVVLIDELEDRGFVQRHQDPDDRRRNVIELTESGRDVLDKAMRAVGAAEREFLSPLTASEAEQFKRALDALLPAH